MSKEVSFSEPTGHVYYFVLKRLSDGQYVNGTTPEAFVSAHWVAYAIAITEYAGATGQYHGDFPIVAAGVYRIEVYRQAGGSPALSDGPPYLEGDIQWDGTRVVPLGLVLPSAVPGAGGGIAIASQVPANFTTATFVSAGVFSTGALANAPGGGGGDPWATDIPGSYTGNQAGAVVGKGLNFPVVDITGVVANSPAPTATAVTITLDTPLNAGTVAAHFLTLSGVYVTYGAGSPVPPFPGRIIAPVVVHSTTSVSVTFAAGTFGGAPNDGDPAMISG